MLIIRAVIAMLLLMSMTSHARGDTIGTVLGIVRTQQEGTIVAHARLELHGDAYHAESFSDARGRYIFFGAPPGRYELSARATPLATGFRIFIDVHAGTIDRCDLKIPSPRFIVDIGRPSMKTTKCPSSSP